MRLYLPVYGIVGVCRIKVCVCLHEGLEMKGAKGEPGDAVVDPT